MANRLKIRFRRAPEYRVVAATGVWGGVTPSAASVLANFTVDMRKDPDEVVMSVEGAKVTESSRKGDSDEKGDALFDRELQVGVLLNPTDAYTIGLWFIEKAKEAGFRTEQESH